MKKIEVTITLNNCLNIFEIQSAVDGTIKSGKKSDNTKADPDCGKDIFIYNMLCLLTLRNRVILSSGGQHFQEEKTGPRG